jgi:hypothetical protein
MLMSQTTSIGAAVREVQTTTDQRFEALIGEVRELKETHVTFEQGVLKEFADFSTRLKYIANEFQKHCSGQARDMLELQSAIEKLKLQVSSNAPREIVATSTPALVPFEPTSGALKHVIDPVKEEIRMLKSTIGLIERDIDDRTNRLKALIEGKFKEVKNMLGEFTEGKGRDDIGGSQGIELMTMMQITKASIVKLGMEMRDMKEQIETLKERGSDENRPAPPPVGEALEQARQRQIQNARFDSFGERLDSLGVTVASLGAQLSVLSQKQAWHDHSYRCIIYGLIDGLRTIHAHADGLEEIPVQNFATVAHEYFAEDPAWETLSAKYVKRFPQKTVVRGSSPREFHRLSQMSSVPEPTPEPRVEQKVETAPTPEEEEIREEAPPVQNAPDTRFDPALLADLFRSETRRRSGLLHLVGHAGKGGDRGNPTLARDGIAVVPNPDFAPEERVTTQTPTYAMRVDPVLTTAQIVVADIVGQGFATSPRAGLDDDTLRELRAMIGIVSREKAEIVGALDRKVDREFVERLFNKFRAIIVAMNDRVRELGTLTERFATQKDIKAVTQLVSQIPDFNETAASRVGPECLICGRPRGQVGGIAPQDEDEPPLHYVYGDGGMFRKTAGLVGRIGLPPLKPGPPP